MCASRRSRAREIIDKHVIGGQIVTPYTYFDKKQAGIFRP